MPIRQIRATLRFVFILLALLCLQENSAVAEESLRIARPAHTSAQAQTGDCAGCCSAENQTADILNCTLPPQGLYEQWRAEFINPTLCPILICHGSCRRSQMSCKFIKPMLDSLLDAYVPEEPSLITVLNFRCCAGFSDE